MTDCTQLSFELPGLCRRKIEGNFAGGNLSSDGGLVLLRQVDRFMGLTKQLAKRLPDRRDPDKIEHSLQSLLRRRIYAIDLEAPATCFVRSAVHLDLITVPALIYQKA